jgi:translation elongation factor EF-G
MDELQRLFGHCGLSGIDSWIAKHREVEKFFAAQSRLSDTPKSQLRQIVEYRNEAAHQEVDEVLGTEVLLEVMEFFEALLRSVTDFVQYEILRRAKERGLAQVLGVISEQFHNDIVVAKVANATLKVGDEIYISGKGVTMIGMVNSIQLDGVDHLSADITSEREVGLALGVRAKLGCELIRLI